MNRLMTTILAGLAVLVMMISAGVQASDRIEIELNKLEPDGVNCRAYMVYRNPTPVFYKAYRLELLVFDPDAVIQKRLAVDSAPIRPHKTTVTTFHFSDLACEQIGSVLLNGFIACKAENGGADDCLDTVVLSSKAKAKFYK